MPAALTTLGGSDTDVCYEVIAINVEITLNRFLDYDPDARMAEIGS